MPWCRNPNGEIYILAEALVEKGDGGRRRGGLRPFWPPIPGPSLRICWPTTPSCPRPPVWCWRTMSPWTPVPAASTPLPASAPTTTRPAKRLRDGHGGARGRPGPPHRLRRQVRGAEDRGVQPHHPGGYEGVRRAVCRRGHRPLLPPLLAVQESHHLPGHPPVVLLGGGL